LTEKQKTMNAASAAQEPDASRKPRVKSGKIEEYRNNKATALKIGLWRVRFLRRLFFEVYLYFDLQNYVIGFNFKIKGICRTLYKLSLKSHTNSMLYRFSIFTSYILAAFLILSRLFFGGFWIVENFCGDAYADCGAANGVLNGENKYFDVDRNAANNVLRSERKRLDADCGAAERSIETSGGYPMIPSMRVNYFDGSGALILKGEYTRNYIGITYSEAVRILDGLKRRGYDRTDAAGEIFRGFNDDVKKLRRAYCRPFKNAEAFFDPNADAEHRFGYSEGGDGAIVDEGAIVDALLRGLSQNKADITVGILKSPPEFSAERLKELTKRRASFSTGYSNSKPERKYNIALAAGFISGTVIPPDGIFSFNEKVGKRTAARGFREAPIIFDGRLVGGVGGGVCQVSTTIYNAALYADLEIVHAKRHSSVVGYVKPSFDAMVSEYNDLKIKNNTGFPLYIAANADESRLKIEFFGKPMEKGLKISLRSEIKQVINCEDNTLLNDGSYEIPEEGFFRISRGTNGCVSEGYADYYRGGVLERSERIRNDTYKPMNGIVVRRGEAVN
jgi:hypothetical protein